MCAFVCVCDIIYDVVDFANSPQIFPQTCSGTCYLDYVINNGTEEYKDAYFEVGYVRVFSTHTTSTTTTTMTSSGRRKEIAVTSTVVTLLLLLCCWL